ncbi:2Fe-2S iron-sulfur cluster-binding protein, partial [Burkholderia glumae]
MRYRIELTTRDGARFDFGCESGQDVLAAAAEADITLPSQCRRGSCGACQANAVDGGYTMRDYSADALPAGQRGAVLLCRTVPLGDLRLTAPYDAAKVLLHPVPARAATIAALDAIAEHTLRLELQVAPDDVSGSAVEFE